MKDSQENILSNEECVFKTMARLFRELMNGENPKQKRNTRANSVTGNVQQITKKRVRLTLRRIKNARLLDQMISQ